MMPFDTKNEREENNIVKKNKEIKIKTYH